MLRWRCHAGRNFVTHAQIAVNPLNATSVPHTDWAQDFPFAALGLPDNYTVPPASLYAFGFSYDDVFLTVSGGGWKGLALAEDRLARDAARQGATPDNYRTVAASHRSFAAALEQQASKEQSGGGIWVEIFRNSPGRRSRQA